MRHQTIGETIEDSVRRCKKKGREQIADELGVGYSNFSRMLNPNDEGARFPAELLIPVMKATGNYSPLKHIAARTGHLVINVKRLRVPKGQAGERDVQMALHETFNSLMKHIMDFMKEPSLKTKEKLLKALDAHLGEGVAARKKFEKWEQPELEFED